MEESASDRNVEIEAKKECGIYHTLSCRRTLALETFICSPRTSHLVHRVQRARVKHRTRHGGRARVHALYISQAAAFTINLSNVRWGKGSY